MKQLMILLLFIGLLFSSCNGSLDQVKCFESAQKFVPEMQVVMIPNTVYRFIAVDTIGNVYYISTMSSKGPEVTSKIQLYKK